MRQLPHNFIKRSVFGPFDEIQTLFQCAFPLKRRCDSEEGARILGRFAQNLALEQSQLAMKALPFMAVGFAQYVL